MIASVQCSIGVHCYVVISVADTYNIYFLQCACKMSAFPPVWEVDDIDDYDSFHLGPSQDQELCGKLLMPLSPGGRSTGAFRIMFFGHCRFTVALPVCRVFTPIPAAFSALTIAATFDAEVMTPKDNSVTTPWMDVVDLLRDKSAVLQDEDKKPVDPTPLVQHLTDAAAKKSNLGASVRWALAVSVGGTLQYELQLLPVPPRLLNKQNLKQDNAVSVLLLVVPVKMELFKDPQVSGPVPHLFHENPDDCFELLRGDLSGILEDIRMINSKFLWMEHVTMADAVRYITGRGRQRAARGVPAFTVETDAGPANKRLRHSSAASSDSGN